MGKFIRKSLALLTVCAVLFAGTAGFILFGLPEQFGGTYQHALSRQAEALPRIGRPKVVVMGDSSVPFSLDSARMGRMLGRPVQTLGIHSGTGAELLLNLSRGSVRKGDIMVFELAPDQAGDVFSPSLVLTACENNFWMYRSFTEDDWTKTIRYYPSYLIKKIKYCNGMRDAELPSYSIDSFDGNGNYIYRRVGCRMPEDLTGGERDIVFSRKEYPEAFLEFLNRYNRFCEEKGATFLITFSPFLDESLASGQASLGDVQAYLSGKLKAPVITEVASRELPRRYFYNNSVHCNTAGAELVTRDLADEIRAYFAGRKPGTVNHRNGGVKGSVPRGGAPLPVPGLKREYGRRKGASYCSRGIAILAMPLLRAGKRGYPF